MSASRWRAFEQCYTEIMPVNPRSPEMQSSTG